MAFKMKGSAFKLGNIQGTAGYKSALAMKSPMKNYSTEILRKREMANTAARSGEGGHEVDISPGSEFYKSAKAHDQAHIDYNKNDTRSAQYPHPHGGEDKRQSSDLSAEERRSRLNPDLVFDEPPQELPELTQMKSPLEGRVSTEKMAARTRESDAGISGKIRRKVSKIGDYVTGKTKRRKTQKTKSLVGKDMAEAVERGKTQGKVRKLGKKAWKGMKEKVKEKYEESPAKMKSPLEQWTYDCPECGLEFETFPELASHISSAHLGGGDPTPGPDRTIEFGPVTPGSGGGGDDDDDNDKKTITP